MRTNIDINMKYKGIIYKENNGYWIDFPEIEGCHTQGDTLEELLENAKEVLNLCLEENVCQR